MPLFSFFAFIQMKLNSLNTGAMALAFQSGEAVKQALFEQLQNLLNADKDIRTNAEGRIKQLEFTEGKNVKKRRMIMSFFICLNISKSIYFFSHIHKLAMVRLWCFSC